MKIHSGVLRSMFGDFLAHKETDRGEDETGWLLLGTRKAGAKVIEAALPAGEFRDAGVSHVNMNSTAQAVAMRILKKAHPELDVLGVAHTHPGRLNRPSNGDFQGDRLWVPNLRGGEGIFAIGIWSCGNPVNPGDGPMNTCGEDDDAAEILGAGSRSHSMGGAVFNWFSLASGESWYRGLSVEETPGVDLGLEIRGHWDLIEFFAGSIERLVQMQPGIQMGLIPLGSMATPTMVLCQPLARAGEELQVVLQGRGAGFFHMGMENPEEIAGPPENLVTAFYEVMARLSRGSRREAGACFPSRN